MSSDKYLLLIIMSTVYITVGCVFLIIYFAVKASQNRKLNECTSSVEGYLLGGCRRYHLGSRYGMNKDFNYYPTIRYVVNGVEYIKSWNYGKTKQWTPGPIVVKYNPDNPNDCYLKDISLPKIFRRAMLAAGIGCCSVGLLLFVLFFVI